MPAYSNENHWKSTSTATGYYLIIFCGDALAFSSKFLRGDKATGFLIYIKGSRNLSLFVEGSYRTKQP